MTSWAAVAQASAPARPKAVTTVGDEQVVVVDANAIISGVVLDRLSSKAFTTPEVLQEIRDKQSRHRLATLPFGIQTMEPSEESVKSVTRFARLTGDLHMLSAVDLQLIALAHTLEAATNGSQHLRTAPAAPHVVSKQVGSDGQELPGWGEEGDKWEALDAIPDSEARVSSSRISSAALPLGHDEEGCLRPGSTSCANGGDGYGAALVAEARQLFAPDVEAGNGVAAASTRLAEAGSGGGAGEAERNSAGVEDAEGGVGDWEVAGKSRAAERRKKMKDRRKDEWQDAQLKNGIQLETPHPPAAAAGSVCALSHQQSMRQGSSQHAVPLDVRCSAEQLEANDSPACGVTSSSEDEDEDELYDTAADDEDDDDKYRGREDGGGKAASQEGSQHADDFQSQISILTADFAMQNIILQMGLQLIAPNGCRLTQLSRWALRCTACSTISKDVGRIFCPRCGNATMDKVRVTTTQNGCEQFGVRKKHVLRGTRFSLPKPKGGKHSANPILSEDVLLQKMGKLRKKKSGSNDVDPFAPEYNDATWFKMNATNSRGTGQVKGLDALMADWKRNPNERRNVGRTNRRK